MGENDTSLERLWEGFCDDYLYGILLGELVDEAAHADVHDNAEGEEGEEDG